MQDEIEATFTNIDKDTIRAKLRSVGAQLIKPEFTQSRAVFNIPDIAIQMPQQPYCINEGDEVYIIFGHEQKRLKIDNFENGKSLIETIYSTDIRSRQNKGWLRVRNEGNRITMTYKRQDSSLIDGMREIEIVIDDFQAGFQFFEYLKCPYKAYQETKRELWQYQGVDITIDEWPYLNPFVEVEGNNEAIVREVSTELGFDWNTAHFGAVDALYAERYGISTDQINNHTPRILFNEKNPFVS